MKRILASCMALALTLLCGACGTTNSAAEQSVVVAEAAASIDIDLTNMSSTMIYSEVSQIVKDPSAYIGKTIRAKGTFREKNGYYFILINDATACCAQGLEFIWAGKHSFPEDYPEAESDIVVTGTFEDYREGEKTYYHINNASLDVA